MRVFSEARRQALREATYEVDKAARTQAETVWAKVVRFVEAMKAHNYARLREVQFGPFEGYIVQPPLAGLPAGLSVLFLPKHGGTKASFTTSPENFIMLYGVIHEPNDPSRLASRIESYRESFIHEFVHYLDSLRHKDKSYLAAAAKRARTVGSYAGYVQSAVEFNAFYQEAAHEVERRLLGIYREADDLDPAARDRIRKSVLSHLASYAAFEKFLGTVQAARDLFDSLAGTKWERKLAKRLHGLYDALKAEVEES